MMRWFMFCIVALLLLTLLHSSAAVAKDGPAAIVQGVGNAERAGFRGEIKEMKWIEPPTNVATVTAGPDIDLVAMGRWAQNYLVKNTNPKLNYACRFSLDWSCPPVALGEDLVANGDTDCRLDWEFMYMAEMCGVNQTADAAAGVRKRILGYLGNDNLARVPGAIYCGGVPPDKMYVSTWTTGRILVSLAETFASTGDKAAKQRAREIFVALRGLASQDSGRAWYAGGVGPYLDGKWYDTFGTVNYGCQTEPVFRYWELTGDPEVLQFAQALARGSVEGIQANLGCRRIRPDGSFSDHTHLHTNEVWGVAHVGAVMHDPRLLEWARRTYEYVRSCGTDYGWFPERTILKGDTLWDKYPQAGNNGFPERVHHSETCVTGDMVNIAACLAQGGYPEYWDHVERYVRNYIRATQFIMTPKAEAYYRKTWQGKPAADVEAALAAVRHYQGGCGAMVEVNGGPQRWEPCGCCVASGMDAIYRAWKNTVTEDARGVRVNMSFSRESPSVAVHSFLPEVGQLSATARKPGDFYLRPPAWTPRGAVQTFRNGKLLPAVWRDGYVLFSNVAVGEELAVAYPLPEFVQQVGVGGKLEEQRPYRMRWRGNTCLGVEPRAAEFPFFEDVLPVLPDLPRE